MATERWGSRLGLVLAMAGNAVGLGNFLRFPAQAAQNGGGAFLVPYLVALLVMGIPLIWVEWTMGRYGGQLGHHSTPGIFQSMGRHPMWKYLGVFGLWTNLIIAAYYLYIETWTMAFAGYSLVGGFSNPEMTGKKFHEMITGELPNQVFAVSRIGLVLFFACISINIYILSRGLAKGIEIVSKIGMPLLIGFGAVLAIRGLMISPETDPKAVANPLVGLNFVWEPKYDRLTEPSVWLAAAGQIFFTLSVGMGSAHCYASYLREQEDVTLTGATASWTNEFLRSDFGRLDPAPDRRGLSGTCRGSIAVRFRPGVPRLSDVVPELGLARAFRRIHVVRPVVFRGDHQLTGDGPTGPGIPANRLRVYAPRRRARVRSDVASVGGRGGLLPPERLLQRIRLLGRIVSRWS